jgi:hypothetical protein
MAREIDALEAGTGFDFEVSLALRCLGAVFFLPAYFRSMRTAERRTKLSSLQRWASACAELLVGLDLRRRRMTCAKIESQRWSSAPPAMAMTGARATLLNRRSGSGRQGKGAS